jgi:preprotein translocase subunit SecE
LKCFSARLIGQAIPITENAAPVLNGRSDGGYPVLLSDFTGPAAKAREMAKFNPGKFLREVRAEASNITWPTWPETLQTAIMVTIFTFILALFFLGIDSVFNAIVTFLLNLA